MRATGVAVLALCLLLVVGAGLGVGGCGGDDGAALIGRWANEDAGESIEFRPDGSVTISSGESAMQLTYRIEGDTIRLKKEESGETKALVYSLEGDSLTLTADGTSVTYDRTE